MGRSISDVELECHKNHAIQAVENYINTLIASGNLRDRGKADKLSYWLKDWSIFLAFESNFDPTSLRRYKRGEIIKAHLGYNVGSEEGGLHYCVVIDKQNSHRSPVVTVIPLTSIKATTNLDNLRPGSVYLGNELFVNLSSKYATLQREKQQTLDNLQAQFEKFPHNEHDNQLILHEIDAYHKQLESLQKTRREITRMKNGSIALVSQIRCISKIRIFDPKTNNDVLHNVKLSNEKLDQLDSEIMRLFIKQNPN